MRFPDRKTVEKVKAEFPVGCRIVLDAMDDPQSPEIGTQGTVIAVDDTASICPAWDTGGSLNIVFEADSCHKIRTEEEAMSTLNWYGKHQPDKDARCPRCGEMMKGPTARHALSRWAQITVCDRCGMEEALEKAGLMETKPMMKWAAVEEPQNGGRKWTG